MDTTKPSKHLVKILRPSSNKPKKHERTSTKMPSRQTYVQRAPPSHSTHSLLVASSRLTDCYQS